MYRSQGLGVSLAVANQQVKKANDDLAAQRRLYESDQAQASAMASSGELQDTVLRWLPRVGLGIAVLVGGYLMWKRSRR